MSVMRPKQRIEADRFLTNCRVLTGETLEDVEWTNEEIEQRRGNLGKIFASDFGSVISGLVNLYSNIQLYIPELLDAKPIKDLLLRLLYLLVPPSEEEIEPETLRSMRKWIRRVLIKLLKYNPRVGIFVLECEIDAALDSICMLNLKLISLIVRSSDQAKSVYIGERDLIGKIAAINILSESSSGVKQFARLVESLVVDVDPQCSIMMLQKLAEYWFSQSSSLDRELEKIAKWTLRALLHFIIIDDHRGTEHPYARDFLRVFAESGIISKLISLELPADSIQLDREYVYLFAWILHIAPEYTEYLCSEDVKLVCWIAHKFHKLQSISDEFNRSAMFIELIELLCSIQENVCTLGTLMLPMLPFIFQDFDAKSSDEKQAISRFAIISLNSPDMNLIQGIVMISGHSLLDMRPVSYDPCDIRYFLQTWLNLMSVLPQEIAEEVKSLAQESEMGDWISSVPEEFHEEREMAELLMEVMSEY